MTWVLSETVCFNFVLQLRKELCNSIINFLQHLHFYTLLLKEFISWINLAVHSGNILELTKCILSYFIFLIIIFSE